MTETVVHSCVKNNECNRNFGIGNALLQVNTLYKSYIVIYSLKILCSHRQNHHPKHLPSAVTSQQIDLEKLQSELL